MLVIGLDESVFLQPGLAHGIEVGGLKLIVSRLFRHGEMVNRQRGQNKTKSSL